MHCRALRYLPRPLSLPLTSSRLASTTLPPYRNPDIEDFWQSHGITAAQARYLSRLPPFNLYQKLPRLEKRFEAVSHALGIDDLHVTAKLVATCPKLLKSTPHSFHSRILALQDWLGDEGSKKLLLKSPFLLLLPPHAISARLTTIASQLGHDRQRMEHTLAKNSNLLRLHSLTISRQLEPLPPHHRSSILSRTPSFMFGGRMLRLLVLSSTIEQLSSSSSMKPLTSALGRPGSHFVHDYPEYLGVLQRELERVGRQGPTQLNSQIEALERSVEDIFRAKDSLFPG